MGRTARLKPFASPGAADEAIAREKLAVLGIGDLADHDYTRISGGQRQLTLIARALAQEAPILVMDEPTASLDFGNQAMVLGRIRDLAREGYGIVLSTHDPDHALLVATRVADHRRGRPARGRRAAGRGDGRDAVGDLPHRGDRRGHAVGTARLRAGVGLALSPGKKNRKTTPCKVRKLRQHAADCPRTSGGTGDLGHGVRCASRRPGRCARAACRSGMRSPHGAAIVAKKPAALSHVDAAALALTGLTALCSIEDSLKLKSGETILIQGGAGGVASFAIQLANISAPGHHHRQRRNRPT